MINNGPQIPPDVIVLEFNELCPGLMDKLIAAGKLPHFSRLRDRSLAMITDANEDPPNLEPWIQWATIHSGMKADEHGVFDLGEGRKINQECVAKILSDSGIRVGVLGSMNTNYHDLNGFYIPDPWDLQGQAEPRSLQPFYETVSKQVQESSKEGGLSKKDLLQFGWFMIRHGMKPSTVWAGIRQLWSEFRNKATSWRRPMILERLQFDLFLHLKKKYQTRFNTFFCNSTAHFQHYYWRNMEPDIFVIPPSEEDDESLRFAIEEGYQQMDKLVGRFLNKFPNSSFVLLTALSQKPWRETTKCTFRPADFGKFLKFCGLENSQVEIKPVMAEEFHVICPSAETQSLAQQKILQLTLDGKPVMKARPEEGGLFCGCLINEYPGEDRVVSHPDGGQIKFGELFHMVHSMRSGRHHPHGIFWLPSEKPGIVDQPIPLEDVAPTLLGLYGIAGPEYMTGKDIKLVPSRTDADALVASETLS